MGTGYVRNDTGNNIADGNVINASDLDGEFDAIVAAFNASTGHSHDGTTGEGPQIDTAGLADDAVTPAKLDETGSYTVAQLDVDNLRLDANALSSTNTNGNVQLAADGTGVYEFRGNDNSAKIVLNCEVNTHGITIASPPHSAGATYTLELPDADGTSGQALTTDGSGKLSFADFVTATSTTTLTNKTIVAANNTITIAPGDLTGVTADASELNILDGVTATTAELNYLDITTLGTTEASKAVTADANGVVTFDNGTISETTAITSSSNAATLDLQAGDNFTHILTENVTYTFSNPAASGKASAFTLKVVQDASASGYTITWPASVDWAAATAPTLTADANGVDYFVFITTDGGTNYYGFVAGQAFA